MDEKKIGVLKSIVRDNQNVIDFIIQINPDGISLGGHCLTGYIGNDGKMRISETSNIKPIDLLEILGFLLKREQRVTEIIKEVAEELTAA